MTTAQKIKRVSRLAELANEIEPYDSIDLETQEFNEWFDAIRVASDSHHAASLLAADSADIPARYRF